MGSICATGKQTQKLGLKTKDDGSSKKKIEAEQSLLPVKQS